MSLKKIAIVGATGNAGREMLNILSNRNVPCENVIALASERSEGDTIAFGNKDLVIENLANYDFSDTEIALFSAGGNIAEIYAPIAAEQGCVVIDNSSKSINSKIKKIINKDTIVLLNKSDVLNKQNHKFDADTVLASVKENKNIDTLIKKIKEKLSKKFMSNNTALITRERHRQHLLQCVDHLNNFSDKNDKKDFDKGAEDLRLATRQLGMIVGKVDVVEILGSIFNDFCIGK